MNRVDKYEIVISIYAAALLSAPPASTNFIIGVIILLILIRFIVGFCDREKGIIETGCERPVSTAMSKLHAAKQAIEDVNTDGKHELNNAIRLLASAIVELERKCPCCNGTKTIYHLDEMQGPQYGECPECGGK